MAKSRKIEPIHIFIEIVVITIGILIAYQLNNLKETRKTEEAERKILSEIKSNLQLDKIDMIGNKQAHQRSLVYVDSLRNWDGPYTDNIPKMIFDVFRDYIFIPQTSAFETLKSKGVDLIQNDSIRVSIQRMHDFNYQALIQYESEYTSNQFHDDFMFIVENYYQSFPLGEDELPIPKVRSAEWLKDSEVRVRLDMCAFEHRFTLRMYEMVEKDIDDLCAAIDRELEE